MEGAGWEDITWTAIVFFVLLFGALCFLAVLWSRREWKSRKIRVGLFLEREYRDEPPDIPEEDTAEWPSLRRDDDAR